MTRIAMLLENNPYPGDPRVRPEAQALAGAGYQVTVCAPRGEGQPPREVIAGVRVSRWRLPKTKPSLTGFLIEYLVANLQLHWAGCRELARGADVLHLHNPPDTLFPVALLARMLGRKVIFDHHDMVPELMEAKFGPGPMVRLTMACERLSMGVANVVIANNQSHRDVALGRGNQNDQKVVVIRNGPPSATLVPPQSRRGGPLEDPHLVFVGLIETQDGVDELPELLVRLARDHGLEKAHLTVVGSGTGLSAFKRAVAEAGVAERVRCTGQVPHTEVPRLLAEADICVDPAPCTTFNEFSTNMKIAEYMAAARPIVTYSLLETRRTAGEAGAYADCGDPASFARLVAELAADAAQREMRAQAGTQRVRELVWERQEERLLATYSRLVAPTTDGS